MTPLPEIAPARNAAPPVASTTPPMDMMVPHMMTMPHGTEPWNSFQVSRSMPGRNMTVRPMRATTVALRTGTQLPTIHSTSMAPITRMAFTS